MSERTPHLHGNGRPHVIGLGSPPESEALRQVLDGVAHVEWVSTIYAAAAEQCQKRQIYRAVLLDLRALSRLQLDAALGLARRAGLPVWLLPVEVGRTRLQAALAAGALAWPQVLDQEQALALVRPPIAPAVRSEPLKTASPTAAIAAARLAEVLLDPPQSVSTAEGAPQRNTELSTNLLVHDRRPAKSNGHSGGSAPARATPGNGSAAQKVEQQDARQAEPAVAPVSTAAPAAVAPSAPSAPAASHAAPAVPPSLADLPARFFAPARAPATSENKITPDPAPPRMTSAPPPEYDEFAPVLTEEEFRALLGPPE